LTGDKLSCIRSKIHYHLSNVFRFTHSL
jgi:hypothetical protein